MSNDLFVTEEWAKAHGVRIPEPKHKIGDEIDTDHGRRRITGINGWPLLMYDVDVDGATARVGFEEAVTA